MDEELAKLRQQLRDEQRRRQEAEASTADEQRRRREAEASTADEQRRRREAEASAADEQRRREEAEASAADEQRRREEAEASSEYSRPQDLLEYLEYCHRSFNRLTVVSDKSSTTQGHTTDPTSRQFPQRIVPWYDFLPEQDQIWNRFATHTEFCSKKSFPSKHQLDYVRDNLRPISSETGLRDHARETIENLVRMLIGEAYKDEPLRHTLQLQGSVAFESHTNIGESSESIIEEGMEHMIIAGPSTPIRTIARARELGQITNKPQGKAKQASSTTSGQRRGGLSDQFCILEIPGKGKAAIMSIEYKAPHKFSLDNIIAGLAGEIRPAEDVINQEGTSFEFQSKVLAAAVVTQLFSDMIRKGVRWGYICTGEANIFLHIPGEPSIVYFHLSIPKLDYQVDDKNSIYRTAVAQVSAFVLRATWSEAPSQSWRDDAEMLPQWPVEYIDVLKDIPPTPPESEKREGSEYTSRYIEAYRSPIVTRGNPGCKDPGDHLDSSGRDDRDDGDGGNPSTPSPAQGGSQIPRGKRNRPRERGKDRGAGKRDKGHQKHTQVTSRPKILDRPYCTHLCLLGLASGGAMDKECPNIGDHPRKHVDQETFLYLIRDQLATDRGSDADCTELWTKGRRGALFKVRLSSHGYTLVAKGVERHNDSYLEHEHGIYDHLLSLQGTLVPVCLGSVELKLPYYYDSGKYTKMLFLSWAGRPLFDYLKPANAVFFQDRIVAAVQALHKLQVLHKDAELRNILWNEQGRHLMIIDFEGAELHRQPLGVISPNRKRKRPSGMQKQTIKNVFLDEVQKVKMHISKCVQQSVPETR